MNEHNTKGSYDQIGNSLDLRYNDNKTKTRSKKMKIYKRVTVTLSSFISNQISKYNMVII